MVKKLSLITLTVSLLAIVVLATRPTRPTCSALPNAPELDKPITVRVKGQELADVVSFMEKQSGVRLACHRNIAERKITIFVDSKPLKDVMNGITTLLGYQWITREINGKIVYEVFESDEARQSREDERQLAYENAWKRLSNDLLFKIELSSKTKAEIQKIKADYEKQIQTGPTPEAYAKMYAAKTLLEKGYLIPCLQACWNFSPDWMASLRKGGNIRLDSDSTDPKLRLPEPIKRAILETYRSTVQFASDSPEPTGLTVIYSITSDANEFRAEAYIETTTKSGGRSTVAQVHLAQSGVISHEEDPKDKLPHKAVDESFKKKLVLTRDELIAEAGIQWQSKAKWPLVTRADMLALLHKKTGVQVITDYYTEWSNQPELTDTSIEDALSRLKGRLPYCTWGWDGTFIYLRATQPWVADADEIPNKLIRKWKAAISNGGLGLDELAEIASLTDRQRSILSGNRLMLGLGGAEFWARPTVGLDIWKLLTYEQRKAAWADGLTVGLLSPKQQDELSQLLAKNKPERDRRPQRVTVLSDLGGSVTYEVPAAPPEEPGASTVIWARHGVVEEIKAYQTITERGHAVREEAASLEEAIKKGAERNLDFRDAVRVSLKIVPYELLVTYSNGSERILECGNSVSIRQL